MNEAFAASFGDLEADGGAGEGSVDGGLSFHVASFVKMMMRKTQRTRWVKIG